MAEGKPKHMHKTNTQGVCLHVSCCLHQNRATFSLWEEGRCAVLQCIAVSGWACVRKGMTLLNANTDHAGFLFLPVTVAQGVRATAASPNPYLLQSLAVLAADMGRTDEARKWFHKGSSTLMVYTFCDVNLTADDFVKIW